MRTEADGLAFARSYGLLFASQPKPGYRESFRGWLGHARDVRGALTMYAHTHALAGGNDVKDEGAILQELKTSIAPFRARLGPNDRRALDQYTLEEQANILIAEIINARLPPSAVAATALLEQEDEHGRWSVAKGAPPSFLWCPRFSSL